MGPLAEGGEVLDDEGVLHAALIAGKPRRTHISRVDGLDGRLGGHATARHGEVHAAHLVAHVHAEAGRLAGQKRPVEHVLRHHVVAALGHHVPGVLDHLGAPNDGRHRRWFLKSSSIW